MPITAGDNGLAGGVPSWRLPIEPLDFEPARRSHPLNRDRLAWWLALPGKSGGQQWLDVMGLSPATLISVGGATVQWVASSRPGGTGAIDFSGNRYCDVGSSSAFALSRSFAVAAWVRPTTIGPTMAVICRGSGGFLLRVDGVGKLDWLCASVADIVGGSTPLIAATWAHVAATVDGTGNVRLFVNGKLDGSATSTQTYAGPGLQIGAENGNSGWVGQMDDVSFWGRQLSDGEVGQLYTESARGYPAALRGTREGFMAAAAAGVVAGAIGTGAITLAGGGTASPSVVAAGAVGVGTITLAGGGTTGAGAVGVGTITLAGGGTASGGGANIFDILASYRRRRNG